MIGERIRSLRESRGWTRDHLAAQLGVSASQVYKWERNVHEPGASSVAAMVRLFGVTPDYILFLVDAPHQSLLESALTDEDRELLSTIRSGDAVGAVERVLRLAKTRSDTP